MFVRHRTQGIVLKKINRKEADQLFTIYTKDFGKLRILGKGIRKISSKLRSGMDIIYLSKIEFIQGKIYKTLTDTVLIEGFKNLRKDFKKTIIAQEILEVLDNLIQGQEPEIEIWDLLLEVLKDLNHSDSKIKNPRLIYYYFFWNFLSILGYKPELYQCSICQKKLRPGKLYFHPRTGGVICQSCFIEEKSAKEISSDIIKILRIILDKDRKIISKLKIEDQHFKLLKEISKNYFIFISEKTIK